MKRGRRTSGLDLVRLRQTRRGSGLNRSVRRRPWSAAGTKGDTRALCVAATRVVSGCGFGRHARGSARWHGGRPGEGVRAAAVAGEAVEGLPCHRSMVCWALGIGKRRAGKRSGLMPRGCTRYAPSVLVAHRGAGASARSLGLRGAHYAAGARNKRGRPPRSGNAGGGGGARPSTAAA